MLLHPTFLTIYALTFVWGSTCAQQTFQKQGNNYHAAVTIQRRPSYEAYPPRQTNPYYRRPWRQGDRITKTELIQNLAKALLARKKTPEEKEEEEAKRNAAMLEEYAMMKARQAQELKEQKTQKLQRQIPKPEAQPGRLSQPAPPPQPGRPRPQALPSHPWRSRSQAPPPQPGRPRPQALPSHPWRSRSQAPPPQPGRPRPAVQTPRLSPPGRSPSSSSLASQPSDAAYKPQTRVYAIPPDKPNRWFDTPET